MILNGVADETFNYFMREHENNVHQYMFSFLPSMDRNRNPIPNTELIKISRGSLVILGLALVLSIGRCFLTDYTGRRPATIFSVIVGVIAILALLVSLCIQAPEKFWIFLW